MKKPYLHEHNREQLFECKVATTPQNHNRHSEAAKLSCIMLHCAVSSTAVHLSCLRCRAHCLSPLACDRGATVRLVWALGCRRRQLRVADAWLFCGCPPSTNDRCQGSSWTATLHHATPVLPPRPTGYTSLLGRRSPQPRCTNTFPSCHT